VEAAAAQPPGLGQASPALHRHHVSHGERGERRRKRRGKDEDDWEADEDGEGRRVSSGHLDDRKCVTGMSHVFNTRSIMVIMIIIIIVVVVIVVLLLFVAQVQRSVVRGGDVGPPGGAARGAEGAGEEPRVPTGHQGRSISGMMSY
jgi:hypothetical protein